MAEADRLAVLGRALPRFSVLAAASVTVLALTGVYSSLLHVAGPGGLVTTVYGRALLLKLGLLLPVLGLAAYNLLVFGRRLRRAGGNPDGRGFWRAVAGEAALLAGVVLVAGFLANAAPARAVTGEAAGPFQAERRTGPYTVAVTVSPNEPGFNDLTVTVTDRNGDSVNDGTVTILVTRPDGAVRPQEGRAVPEGQGRYLVSGLALGLDGAWSLDVTVAAGSGPPAEAGFSFRVPPPPPICH